MFFYSVRPVDPEKIVYSLPAPLQVRQVDPLPRGQVKEFHSRHVREIGPRSTYYDIICSIFFSVRQVSKTEIPQTEGQSCWHFSLFTGVSEVNINKYERILISYFENKHLLFLLKQLVLVDISAGFLYTDLIISCGGILI